MASLTSELPLCSETSDPWRLCCTFGPSKFSEKYDVWPLTTVLIDRSSGEVIDRDDMRRWLVGEEQDTSESDSGVCGEVGDGQLKAGLSGGDAFREPNATLCWVGSSTGEES